MMDRETLLSLDSEELRSYLRSRLLQESLDPPLSPRTQEAPEFFILGAIGRGESGFRARLGGVVLDLLEDAKHLAASDALDDPKSEYVRSLAYMSEKLGLTGAPFPIYELALLGMSPEPPYGHAVLRSLLRALTVLQSDDTYAGLWGCLWDENRPELNALAFEGLRECAPERALQQLHELIDRSRNEANNIPLDGPAWLLMTDKPGPQAVAAALRGRPDDAAAFRAALEQAGASDAILRDLDLPLQPADQAEGFRFSHNIPRHWNTPVQWTAGAAAA